MEEKGGVNSHRKEEMFRQGSMRFLRRKQDMESQVPQDYCVDFIAAHSHTTSRSGSSSNRVAAHLHAYLPSPSDVLSPTESLHQRQRRQAKKNTGKVVTLRSKG